MECGDDFRYLDCTSFAFQRKRERERGEYRSISYFVDLQLNYVNNDNVNQSCYDAVAKERVETLKRNKTVTAAIMFPFDRFVKDKSWILCFGGEAVSHFFRL